MLKDFTKMETFLVVSKEKSFSKASAKLGISQPAVTQQIKFIEDYLDTKVIERKKNGIRLTKSGEQLLTIVQKLERNISMSEKELLKIIDKNFTFILSTSYVIGNYLAPKFLNDIKHSINNDVKLDVSSSKEAIEQLKNKMADIALIESPIFEDGIIYREWMDDEIIIISNQKLPKRLNSNHILRYKWICRDRDSHTRKLFKESLDYLDFPDCSEFNIVSETSSPTTIVNTILHSNKDNIPTVSIVSKHAVTDYIKNGMLFETRLPEAKINRKLYIAYLKDRKHDAFIENVINYLVSKKIS
jgi:DNA-binding transcriptional LysR family regulator